MICLTAELALALAERMAVIATIAYVLSQFRIFRRFLAGRGSLRDKVILSVVFGLMAIGGTYLGIPVRGAIANSRVVGAVVAGLLGGPAVGLAAGLIGGVHRYLVGGFTALACGLSTTVEGLLGGMVYRTVKTDRFDWKLGFATGFLAETLQMIIILAVSRPFDEAWELVKIIGWPMILVNSAGIAIFVRIIRSVTHEEERIAAFHTHKALQIAGLTLPYLRKGLDAESAAQVSRIILETTGAAAVAVTDRNQVLAHAGLGDDHHRPGSPIQTETTRHVVESGKLKIARKRSEIGCPHPGCRLASGVVVPLKCGARVVGTLKLYQSRENTITASDVEFLNGMAGLFAVQLELAELAREAQLAAGAELKALRAQINPHFLFNALNTVMSFCRTDPMKARDLLAHLSEFFRRNLKSGGDAVTFAEELEQVESYLTIEKARFGDRLEVITEADPSVLKENVPPFILQPLVENAVKHGLLPKMEGGTIRIKARRAGDVLELTVSDDGVGLNPDRFRKILAGQGSETGGLGIGLKNVNDRLKNIFGPDHALTIESSPGRGTTVRMKIHCPYTPRAAAD